MRGGVWFLWLQARIPISITRQVSVYAFICLHLTECVMLSFPPSLYFIAIFMKWQSWYWVHSIPVVVCAFPFASSFTRVSLMHRFITIERCDFSRKLLWLLQCSGLSFSKLWAVCPLLPRLEIASLKKLYLMGSDCPHQPAAKSQQVRVQSSGK